MLTPPSQKRLPVDFAVRASRARLLGHLDFKHQVLLSRRRCTPKTSDDEQARRVGEGRVGEAAPGERYFRLEPVRLYDAE
jgi:hypothetical protein